MLRCTTQGKVAMLDQDFRKAMRALTSAVTIISTGNQGQRFGMTATAVTSLSMSPPLLLICVNTAASIHPHLLESCSFCVNILHANQCDVADAFSSKAMDRFATGEWASSHHAIPFLVSAQANIFCETEATYVHGTHRIFVSSVKAVKVRNEVNPLLYQNGQYTIGLGDGVDWVVPIA
jgi:flavin reductase